MIGNPEYRYKLWMPGSMGEGVEICIQVGYWVQNMDIYLRCAVKSGCLVAFRAISGMSTRGNGESCLGPVFRPFSNSHQYRFQIRLRLVDISAFSGQNK